MLSMWLCPVAGSLASGSCWAQKSGGTNKSQRVTREHFFSLFLHCQIALGGHILYQMPGFCQAPSPGQWPHPALSLLTSRGHCSLPSPIFIDRLSIIGCPCLGAPGSQLVPLAGGCLFYHGSPWIYSVPLMGIQ